MTQYTPDPLAWGAVQWDGTGGAFTAIDDAVHELFDPANTHETVAGDLVVVQNAPHITGGFTVSADYWFVWLPLAQHDHPDAPAVKYRVVPNDSGEPSGWSAV